MRRSSRTRTYVLFFILVSPAIVLRLVTGVYPVFKTINLSFRELDLMSQSTRFVGLANYYQLLSDPAIHEIVGFTIAFIVASVALQLVLGMGVASLLNAAFVGRRLVRTVNLIPWAIPTIVAGLAFRWMLDDQYGLITDLISRFTGTRPLLLVHPLAAQISVILVNVWKNTPFMAIVLLAGLQSVPPELYEAARIDGSTAFQRFRHITMPISSPLIVTLALFFVIWQLANFDLILGLTHGGPGVATTVISYRIFQQGMLWFNWGLASALGVVLMAVVAVVSGIGLFLFRRYDVTL